jgi:hypothetical protein
VAAAATPHAFFQLDQKGSFEHWASYLTLHCFSADFFACLMG